ncbi:hypothetical protein KC360_g36 [Hortaea werneckii]|nr:hypothetical protein KC344_g34 [Hortaea werneckii]KAI7180505.1 hypothetical protein KC360_g36 [Hortaea werneckii]
MCLSVFPPPLFGISYRMLATGSSCVQMPPDNAISTNPFSPSSREEIKPFSNIRMLGFSYPTERLKEGTYGVVGHLLPLSGLMWCAAWMLVGILADCSPVRSRASRFFALGSGLSWEVPPRPFPPAVVSWIGTCSRDVGSKGPGSLVKLASNEEALYELG